VSAAEGREALTSLGEDLAAEGTPISPLVVEPGDAEYFGTGAHAGVVETVREGYLLHYAAPRLLAGQDDDLALLAGDYLYALGIRSLATSGDCAAVLRLADLISDCAAAHAEGLDTEPPTLWDQAAAAMADPSAASQ
jgi:hypothetical protein